MGYCVLFVKTLKQWEVTEAIRRSLPEGKGTVFYPCAELWMGSLGRTVTEPLFPGYVFIRSDMGRSELHEFIRERRKEVLSFIKELYVSRERALDGNSFSDDEPLADLSAGEVEFMDFLLGLRHGIAGRRLSGSQHTQGGQVCLQAGPSDALPVGNKADEEGRNGKKMWLRKVPPCGVIEMSYGYREKDGRYVVMEGPLKGQEGHIADVSVRERRAYLDLKVGGRPARAGLEIRSKRVWYPEDKDAPALLGDGAEVNLKDLAAAMMRSRG